MHNLQVEHFISENEEVLFKGTYNINNVNQTGPSISSLIVEVETNPCGYNLLVDNFYNTSDNLIPSNNFLLETITLSSYNKDITIKNGQIQFSAFYINSEASPDSPQTTVNYVLYLTNNADGIYKNVNKIFLDSRTDQRILFFIGQKIKPKPCKCK